MSTLSISIVPAKVLADGSHKIRISVSHKHVTRYIATRFEVDNPKRLKNGQVTGEDANIVNSKLRNILTEYQNALDKIPVDSFTCTQLASYLKNYKSSGTTVSDRWKDYIGDLKEEGRTGTAGLHERTKLYFNEKFGNCMTFDTITHKVVGDFSKYLYLIKKLGDTTVSMHMKRFKVIVNAAKKDNIVRYEIDPFTYYEMPQPHERELDISVDEFKLIRDYNTNIRAQIVARDIFLLSYYLGGINMIDLLKINFKGIEVIDYIRTKTEHTKKGNKSISLSIQPEARKIIDRWIGKNGKLDFRYNFSYENFRKQVNKDLHKIASNLDINKRVVYYSARKSLVQHGYELGIPLETLEYTIGQSMKRNRPIFSYVKIMRKHADNAMRNILDSLQ